MNKIFNVALLSLAVFAGNPDRLYANSVEDAQKDAVEKYALKLSVLCGVNIAVEYDAASLKKNNKDIGYGQTGGSNECNEPLRYIWYACQNASGKASIKKLGVNKVVCRGVPGSVGKLSKSGSSIVVERANEESKYFLRSLKQFQALAGTTLKLTDEDPYHDNRWSQFAAQENPVLDTKSYCLVDGQKKSFDDYNTIYSSHEHQKRKGIIKCWDNGVQILDLVMADGKKTGYQTNIRDDYRSLETYKNSQRHGDQKTFEKGVLASHSLYQMDKEVWKKEYFPNKKMKSYDLIGVNTRAMVEFGESGKIENLECNPGTKNDPVLSKICGFGKASTVKIFDSDGKVKSTVVYKDGVMESQKGGNSDYASKSDVKFSGGKKNGPEKIMGKNGKLAALIQWKDGLRDGPEKIFHSDGKKVVKLVIWKGDKVAESTDFYLNENPKAKETFISSKKKKVQNFYDSGKLRDEGTLISCRDRYNGWCEDGTFRMYSEKSKMIAEQSFKNGSRSGTSKRWHENGKLSSVEEYVDDKLRSSRYYDTNGSLKEAADYEEDGSKKVKKK
jgi:antitoxin component YwqK of YwqJK toxin-antitoxin module